MKVATTALRAIKKVWKSEPTIEGAGVRLRRAFGSREAPLLDPFLLLDDLRSDDPRDYLSGFPWHPHRGIETVTYVLEGRVEHEDSLGNRGVIGAGDLQWMTAGAGVLHQEMPVGGAEGKLAGFQLWLNLPRDEKMLPPRYREVKSAMVPLVRAKSGVEARVVAGTLDGVRGPVRDVPDGSTFIDVALPPRTTWRLPTDPEHTVLAYVIDGEAYFTPDRDAFAHEAVGENYFDVDLPCPCGDGTLVLYDRGEAIEVTTDAHRARFLLLTGRPLGEPVAWYGPIVMNTRDELRQAFEDLRRGSFVKDK